MSKVLTTPDIIRKIESYLDLEAANSFKKTFSDASKAIDLRKRYRAHLIEVRSDVSSVIMDIDFRVLKNVRNELYHNFLNSSLNRDQFLPEVVKDQKKLQEDLNYYIKKNAIICSLALLFMIGAHAVIIMNKTLVIPMALLFTCCSLPLIWAGADMFTAVRERCRLQKEWKKFMGVVTHHSENKESLPQRDLSL